MNICVFCSANDNIDRDYFVATEELGRWIAENGHTLVFGGCNMGLMECVAKSVKDNGGTTVGVVPKKIEERGRVSQYVDRRIDCNNLSDRKQIMLEQSDIFVALPGGIGTLDEIFAVASSSTIGYHAKRVILYNVKNFYAPLSSLLHHLDAQGLLRGSCSQYIQTADTLEELADIISL